MHKYPLSKKHKTPWITYNDDDVADSQFCIEYLNEKFSTFTDPVILSVSRN